MEALARPTWAEIDLNAIVQNAKLFRRVIPKGTALMAAVKADAYGHGAVSVARVLERDHAADWLGVACLDEALELRTAGVSLPILILGFTPLHGVARAMEANVTITVFDEEMLRRASTIAVEQGSSLHVHVKVDTGMGRIGVRGVEDTVRLCRLASSLPGIVWEGIFTHFATADAEERSFALLQLQRFTEVLRALTAAGLSLPPFVHAANSAATIEFPDAHFTMVRVGIGLYGCLPSPHVNASRLGALRQAMHLKSRIIREVWMPPGTPISYGANYVTSGRERIATVPIGYGDGFSRRLTGKAVVLIRGQRAPVVGTICMDQLMVDVTHVRNVAVGDEVILYGGDGPLAISLDEVADWLGTISYEVSCALGERVPRMFRGE